jgi:hypothetical protein
MNQNINITSLSQKEFVFETFMANGLTKTPLMDKVNRTIFLQFSSETDMTKVVPYCYTGLTESEIENYAPVDLSCGKIYANGWTIFATKNNVMKSIFVDDINGSDNNDGLSKESAFKTIQKAQGYARTLTNRTGDVVIEIADGNYKINETLEFTISDSSPNGFATILKGTTQGKTIISSGIELKNWKKSIEKPGAWETNIPTLPENMNSIRDLYVGNKRAVAARNKGIVTEHWDKADDSDLELIPEGYIASGSKANLYEFKNHEDIEFVYLVGWTNVVVPVEKIEKHPSGSLITMKSGPFNDAVNKVGVNIKDPNYIQNVFEYLDEENEWYYDRSEGKIFYIPEGNQNPNDLEIALPVLEKLIEVKGESGNSINGLSFKNLTFKHSAYTTPHIYGHIDTQSNIIVESKTVSSVTISYAQGVCVDSCTFANLGNGALDIDKGVRTISIINNHFKDIGGNAITVGGFTTLDAQPLSTTNFINFELTENLTPDENRTTNRVLVLSNLIEEIGSALKGSVGVLCGYVTEVTVAHNEIRNNPYTGITVGWGWGYMDNSLNGGGALSPYPYKFTTDTVLKNNVIQNNHIHHCNLALHDGGGIYTLSSQPGSIVNGNFIHDNKFKFGGIYFDEGAGDFIDISRNITYNVAEKFTYHNPANKYTIRKLQTESVKHENFFGVSPEEVAFEDKELYNSIIENARRLDFPNLEFNFVKIPVKIIETKDNAEENKGTQPDLANSNEYVRLSDSNRENTNAYLLERIGPKTSNEFEEVQSGKGLLEDLYSKEDGVQGSTSKANDVIFDLGASYYLTKFKLKMSETSMVQKILYSNNSTMPTKIDQWQVSGIVLPQTKEEFDLNFVARYVRMHNDDSNYVWTNNFIKIEIIGNPEIMPSLT